MVRVTRPTNPAARPRSDARGRRYCGGCKTWKPPEQFGRLASGPDGFQPTCKQCQKRYQDAYRARHAEGDAKINRFSVVLDPGLAARLEKAAWAQRQPKTQLVRRALRAYLKHLGAAAQLRTPEAPP